MKSNIKKSSIRFMLLRELKKIRQSQVLCIAVLCYPLLIAVILCILFHKEALIQLPITVVDLDRSVTSRQIIQTLAAAPEISVQARDTDLLHAKQRLLKAKVYGVVFIPPKFEQTMLANLKPEIAVFYNNQFMTAGSTLNRTIYTALGTSISDIQRIKLTSNGIPFAIANETMSPIPIDLHGLFNPTLNFVYILVNGVFPTILQIIMMLTITSVMHSERQYPNGLNFLWRMAKENPFRFFIHKCLAYLIIFSCSLFTLDILLFYFFSMPLRGSLLLLIVGTIAFVMASLACAFMLSVLIGDKVRNFGAASIMTSPAFGFTGLIFPRASMNTFAYLWGSILPVTWYIKLKLDQTLRGVEGIAALKPLFSLILITVIPLVIVGIVRKIIKRRRKTHA